jgi:hypothetical protein
MDEPHIMAAISDDRAPATIGLKDAAAILRIHVDTCRERAAAGIVPGAKIGRSPAKKSTPPKNA